MFRRFVWLLAVGTLSVMACSRPSQSLSGMPAEEFEVAGLSGGPVRLSDFRGKVVLLDFWATWCGPCRQSVPVFQALHERYENRGLAVLGLSVDAHPDPVPGFVQAHHLTYTIGLDTDTSVMETYNVRGIPSIFLLDRELNVRGQWTGWDSSLADILDEEIRKLL